MRWVSYLACMGQVRNMTMSERDHLEELGRDVRITFKWNLKD
jgi:hypothetical protein